MPLTVYTSVRIFDGVSAFEVLGDPMRRQLLDLLRIRPRSVAELTAELDTTQPRTSKHLRVLREAGLVSVRAQAQQRIYAVRPEPLAAIDSWLTPYRWMWESRLDLLAGQLDSMPDEPEPPRP